MKGRRASGAAAGDAAPSSMALRTGSSLVQLMQSSLAPRTSSSSSGMQSSMGMWDVVAWPEEVHTSAVLRRTLHRVPHPRMIRRRARCTRMAWYDGGPNATAVHHSGDGSAYRAAGILTRRPSLSEELCSSPNRTNTRVASHAGFFQVRIIEALATSPMPSRPCNLLNSSHHWSLPARALYLLAPRCERPNAFVLG
ncbi:hypothetical protein C8J57DRAFT_1474640 [Mycena rebaudengoi]|nr:hypothetical protein C8J57DRAFT_1474640 [Mycena rebaudengoi]